MIQFSVDLENSDTKGYLIGLAVILLIFMVLFIFLYRSYIRVKIELNYEMQDVRNVASFTREERANPKTAIISKKDKMEFSDLP